MRIEIDTPDIPGGARSDLVAALEKRGWLVDHAGPTSLDVSLPTGDWDSPFLRRMALARLVHEWQGQHEGATARVRPGSGQPRAARRLSGLAVVSPRTKVELTRLAAA